MLMTIGSINGGTTVAQAQTIGPIALNSVVYAAKFVCGFKPGFTPPQSRVLLGPAIYDYRDFEPGSYATALNVFFATGANYLDKYQCIRLSTRNVSKLRLERCELGPSLHF